MTLRVAILGAGIGAQHLDGYLALPDDFTVHAVCDQAREKAAALAEGVPGCRAETDIEAVIGSDDIDIIDICLPPHLHAPIAIRALQAGHHVVCEKPMADSVESADRMIDAAHAAGRVLSPVFQYRFGHAFDQLRALIAAGLTGEPLVASLETHWNRGADYYAVPWRGTWTHERGGAVLGHAIHIHDLTTQFFGEFTAVSAMLDTRVNPIETDDCASLALRTKSGALVSSSVTLGAADDRSRLRLVFEHLTAESGTKPYAPGQDSWTFTAREAARQAEIDTIVNTTPAQPAGYAGQFQALARQLSGDNHQNVSAESGRQSLDLVAAIYKSNRERREIPLPLANDDPYYRGWQPA